MTFGDLRTSIIELSHAAFDRIEELQRKTMMPGNPYLVHAFFLIHDELRDIAELPKDIDKAEGPAFADMVDMVKQLRESLAKVTTPQELADWAEGIREVRRVR